MREKDPIQCVRDIYPASFVFVLEIYVWETDCVRKPETVTASMREGEQEADRRKEVS